MAWSSRAILTWSWYVEIFLPRAANMSQLRFHARRESLLRTPAWSVSTIKGESEIFKNWINAQSDLSQSRSSSNQCPYNNWRQSSFKFRTSYCNDNRLFSVWAMDINYRAAIAVPEDGQREREKANAMTCRATLECRTVKGGNSCARRCLKSVAMLRKRRRWRR